MERLRACSYDFFLRTSLSSYYLNPSSLLSEPSLDEVPVQDDEGGRGGSDSIRSTFFLFLAMIASFAFMKFLAEWTSLAMVWGFFL